MSTYKESFRAEMIDKVHKGLILCYGEKICTKLCPYNGSKDCTHSLCSDALKLLQHVVIPKVIPLENIHRGMAVWLEWPKRPHPRIPELMLAIGGSSARANKCFICENDMAVSLKDDEYNVTWRAWAYECKPTDEYRKAVEWNGTD